MNLPIMRVKDGKSLILGLAALAAMVAAVGFLFRDQEPTNGSESGVLREGSLAQMAPSPSLPAVTTPLTKSSEHRPLPDPALVDVTFPDGDSVSVRLRGVGPSPPTIEPGTYPTYKQRALDGDPVAALSVGSTLYRCQYAYVDEKNLQERITELEETHIAIIEGRPFYTDDTAAHIMELQHEHRLCKDIPPDDIAAWQDWFVTAARRGNPDAGLLLLQLKENTDLPGLELEELARYVQVAADDRYVPALYAKGQMYAEGHISPADYSNLAYAYAYYYAAASIMRGVLPAHIYETTYSGRVWAKRLAELEARVSPFEMKIGQEIARDILRSKNCCGIRQTLYDNLPKLRSLPQED